MRFGHRGDINTLDCQSSYIISGGQDGLLGVWNQFSGVLKYAIKLPDPVDASHPQAKERMKSAASKAIADNSGFRASSSSSTSSQVSNQIRRTVVALMFHPHWKNVALVMQEGGNVHAVDVSNKDGSFHVSELAAQGVLAPSTQASLSPRYLVAEEVSRDLKP